MRGVPASLDKEKTRLRGALRSGLISREATGGMVSDLGVGKPDLIGVIVEAGLVPGGICSCGVVTISCSGGGVPLGEGGNLKLDGGIFDA